MNYHKITFPDVNNGNGCRVTLWVAGCSHHCEHCHNPQTWAFDSGKPFTEETKERLFEALSIPYIDGLTLSGGEPCDSKKDIVPLMREVKEKFPDKDIWLYSGYTFEELCFNDFIIEGLVDYIVDGTYQHHKRDTSLAFRGSSNQRIFKKVDLCRGVCTYRQVDDSEFD